MRIFRDPNDRAPMIDLDRLAQNLAKQRDRQVELERTIAQLKIDLPGNAEAIAAAGVAFRASINRSASMIELGTAAVEALRMAGYAITAPLAERAGRRWLPADPSDPGNVAAAELENSFGQPPPPSIPEDWYQG